MKKKINVLLVDDDEEDFMIIRDLLNDIKSGEYFLDWSSDYDGAIQNISADGFDIILCDFLLGKNTGIELLKQLRKKNIQTPVILLTGMGDEAVDREAMIAGAADYLEKGKIDTNSLERSIRYSVNQAQTQQKLLEHEQSLLNAEKFAMTGRMAQIIAHEVRNPITNVKLAIQQLKDEIENPNEVILTLGNMIERNCDRINQLITSLLDSTKFLELNPARISFNELVEETIELAADRIKLKGIEVKKELSEDGCHVFVDKEKFKLALLNIVVNAIEAMEEGSGLLKFKTEKQNDKCFLTIQDNGIGMKQENLKRIFEPYFSKKENGIGLGLTSTQNIILNHQGNIKVHSQPKRGTSFIVTMDHSNAN